MKKIFCDRCQVEYSDKTPVHDYFVAGRVEPSDSEDNDSLEYGIETASMDLCQPCVRAVAAECKAFIAKIQSSPHGSAP